MPIEIYNTQEYAHEHKKRTVVLNTDRFHSWIHYYEPGKQDEMHCHNQDQTFLVIEGTLTMRFPDGGEAHLGPGGLATITGGSFYQLHNQTNEPLVMLGSRSGASEATVKIEHGTGRHIDGDTAWAEGVAPVNVH